MEKTKYQVDGIEIYGYKEHESEQSIRVRQIKFLAWVLLGFYLVSSYTQLF